MAQTLTPLQTFMAATIEVLRLVPCRASFLVDTGQVFENLPAANQLPPQALRALA
jgi:hypothetical protein